jgi:hypothetical protein
MLKLLHISGQVSKAAAEDVGYGWLVQLKLPKCLYISCSLHNELKQTRIFYGQGGGTKKDLSSKYKISCSAISDGVGHLPSAVGFITISQLKGGS